MGGLASGHGNSVPRFHLVWGSGPGTVDPFVAKARAYEKAGLLQFKFRHKVTGLESKNGAVYAATGQILAPSEVQRGAPSNREVVGSFEWRAPAVLVASGGIGANFDLVKKNWPARLGAPPRRMISGVPDHVDGLMLGVAEAAGARLINRDRMWHYTEGIQNWDPVWTKHGIRILPGPSSLWFDARGQPHAPAVPTRLRHAGYAGAYRANGL